jgi:hypothetical protein
MKTLVEFICDIIIYIVADPADNTPVDAFGFVPK